MKGVMGNSCAKGCLVYLVVLVVVVIVTAAGLGGFKGKFSVNSAPANSGTGTGTGTGAGAGTQGTNFPGSNGTTIDTSPLGGSTAGQQQGQATANPAPNAPSNSPSNPNDVAVGGLPPTPTFAPPVVVQPTLPVAAPQPQSTPQVFNPVDSQGGVISGEASDPYYVVQPGDTLWSIAQRYGVDVNALRVVNNLTGDTIFPGEVLFLPQGSTAPQQSVPHPGMGGSPGAPQSDRVSPPAVDAPDEVPGMPDTGINRKR